MGNGKRDCVKIHWMATCKITIVDIVLVMMGYITLMFVYLRVDPKKYIGSWYSPTTYVGVDWLGLHVTSLINEYHALWWVTNQLNQPLFHSNIDLVIGVGWILMKLHGHHWSFWSQWICVMGVPTLVLVGHLLMSSRNLVWRWLIVLFYRHWSQTPIGTCYIFFTLSWINIFMREVIG